MSLTHQIAKTIFRAGFSPNEDDVIVEEKWYEWPEDRRKAIRKAEAVIALLSVLSPSDSKIVAAQTANLRDGLMDVTAHLTAAISLLERGGQAAKKGARHQIKCLTKWYWITKHLGREHCVFWQIMENKICGWNFEKKWQGLSLVNNSRCFHQKHN